MRLRLWYGTELEEKNRRMMKEIQRRIKKPDARRQVILVPEQYTLETEKQYLKHTGEKGMMQVEVLSFSRLAYRIFLETGGKNRVFINEQGIHMFLRKILKEQKSYLRTYHHMIQRKGFIDALVKEIDECKQYQISPEMLRQQAKIHASNEPVAGKLWDIAIIYEKMEEALKDKFLHKEDRMEAFRNQLSHSKWIRETDFWVDGFYSYTPNMLRSLEVLGDHTEELNITVYGGPGEEEGQQKTIHKQTSQLKNHFSHKAAEVKRKMVEADGEGSHKSAELKHLKSSFYSLPVKSYQEKLESIQLFAAGNDEAELMWTSLFIQDLVQEQGYRYRDIAVLCPDLEQRRKNLRRVMNLHQIPAYMDETRNIRNHPLMVLLLRGLEVVDNHYPLHGMMAYLKTGYTGLEQDEVEELENFCLRYGIKGNKWKRRIGDTILDLTDQRIEEWRKIVMEPLEKLFRDLETSETVKEMTKAVFQWLEKLEIPQKIEREIRGASNREAFEQKQVYGQLWNELIGLMDQMVEMIGDSKMTSKEYVEILESGIDSMEVGTIPSTLDQVFVGTIERSRLADIKCLFLIGANDGVIPAGTSEDSLLLPVEKAALAQSGCEIGITPEERELQEMFYIYLSLIKPSDKLYISYSLSNEEGAAKRPSIVLDRLQALFPSLTIQDDLLMTPEQTKKQISRPENTFMKLASEIRKQMDDVQIDEIWMDVYRWFYHHKSWKGQVERMLEGIDYHNQCKSLDPIDSEAIFGKPLHASVARLEKYRKCPFSHFVQYGLKPADRKQYDIQPVELGNFLHQALDEFADQVKKKNQNWHHLKPEECDKMMDELLDPLLQNFKYGVFTSSNRYAYAGKRMKQVGKTAVKTMVQQIQKGDFAPTHHEATFGRNGLWPALQYEKKGQAIASLEGRIDRLDTYQQDGNYYYRVIDYKTGTKDLSLQEMYYGLQLQLPIYLQAVLAAQQNQIKANHYPAGIFYYQLDDPTIETNTTEESKIRGEWIQETKLKGLTLRDPGIVGAMDPDISNTSDVLPVGLKKDGDFTAFSMVATIEEFDCLLQHVEQQVIRMAQGILSGDIAIHPIEFAGTRACQYCDFASVCQFDPAIPGNRVNYLPSISKEDALQKITLPYRKKVNP